MKGGANTMRALLTLKNNWVGLSHLPHRSFGHLRLAYQGLAKAYCILVLGLSASQAKIPTCKCGTTFWCGQTLWYFENDTPVRKYFVHSRSLCLIRSPHILNLCYLVTRFHIEWHLPAPKFTEPLYSNLDIRSCKHARAIARCSSIYLRTRFLFQD